MFLTVGLPGTGKTTAARRIEIEKKDLGPDSLTARRIAARYGSPDGPQPGEESAGDEAEPGRSGAARQAGSA